MNRSVLLTAAKKDTEIFRSKLEEQQVDILHYPLERYEPVEDDQQILDTLEQLDQFENIVYGSKRNAQYFVDRLREYDKFEIARERLNLAVNQPTADYLEEEGIPAIHPHSEGEAINLLEFMLRIRRIGETVYPCGDKTSEDLPALLQELDIPVQEVVLFTLEGPIDEKLKEYRDDITAHEPGIVIFHSRRSVNRTLAAFPNLDYSNVQIISGDQAVTDKLQKEDIKTDVQAEGSWHSILEKIENMI
jgi:uroporphyrinogen-III synthase